MCEKVKFMADEYIRDELPEADAVQITCHTKECKDCSDYIEAEREYRQAVKLAEYEPETSVSQAVMSKIIDNVMIVDKPPRRRFVPVGFITAAAVVIIIAVASRGGPSYLFPRPSKDGAAAPENENMAAPAALAYGEAADMDFAEEEGPAELAADEPAVRAFDFGGGDVPAAAPAAEAEAVLPASADDYDDYTVENSGLDITQIYEIYLAGGDRLGAMKDIDVYIAGDSLDIIDKSHKAELDRYLYENSVVVGEIQGKYNDGEYIAVIWND